MVHFKSEFIIVLVFFLGSAACFYIRLTVDCYHAKGCSELQRLMVLDLCGKLAFGVVFVCKCCTFGIQYGKNPDDLEVTKSHSKHQSAFIFVVGNPGVRGSDQNVHNCLNGWVRQRNTNSSYHNENFFGVL